MTSIETIQESVKKFADEIYSNYKTTQDYEWASAQVHGALVLAQKLEIPGLFRELVFVSDKIYQHHKEIEMLETESAEETREKIKASFENF